ncbi:MAG: BNR-4 repeat-containing protein, partial [Fimbriimonadaceae bacterium]|nr:BNR-4 repeat-containing protein [Fimbriimonadaceae bacterium]
MFLTAFLLAAPFGHDHYVSQDGAWCWFADPRAIWVEGKILAGSVSHGGDIRLNVYDPATKESKEVTLAKAFERDDHDNPALLPLPDGRVAAFFTKHTGPDMFISYTHAAGDLLDWTEPEKINPNDPAYQGPTGAINSYTYPNPQMLRDERNRIYLFWRGMNWKPTFATSDDLGQTWSKGQILVSPKGDSPGNRPYTKIAGDGDSRIHIAFTDGHPRNEPTNSIYYIKYERDAIRSSTGRLISRMSELPIEPNEADVVYDGKAEGVRAWIWDVAVSQDGKPVITYSRLPREDSHYYRYARWDGRRWVDRPVVFGGKWFPQTPEGTTEREPHYSGGAVLDPQDPRFVYLSRPVGARFEIERWFTPDGGDTWSHVAVTGSSMHDSV